MKTRTNLYEQLTEENQDILKNHKYKAISRSCLNTLKDNYYVIDLPIGEAQNIHMLIYDEVFELVTFYRLFKNN